MTARGPRTIAGVAVMACAMSVAGVPGAGAAEVSEPRGLLGGHRTAVNERGPASGSGGAHQYDEAWTANSVSRPGRYNAWVSEDQGEAGRRRLNPLGTEGAVGGFDGDWIVYTQSPPGEPDNIFRQPIYGDGDRRTFPPSVNTRHDEYRPSLSGRWLLFTRRNVDTGRHRVMLFDRRTGTLTTLAVDHLGRTVDAGQVVGDYATWWWTGPQQSNVVRYQISSATARRIPKPENHARQHSSAVDRQGTVYFQRRMGRACGSSAELVRHPVGGPVEVLYAYPEGQDGGRGSVDQRSDLESFRFPFTMRTCVAPRGRWDDAYSIRAGEM